MAQNTGNRPNRPVPSPRGDGTPPSPRVTSAELVERLNGTNTRVADLHTAYDRTATTVTTLAEQLATTQGRLGITDGVYRRRHDRNLRLITALGERVGQDHEDLDMLRTQLVELQKRVGHGFDLRLAAAAAGFTTEQVRLILSASDEDELGNPTFVGGILATLDTHRAQLEQIVDTLAETRGLVNEHTTAIEELRTTGAGYGTRLDAIDGDDGAIAQLRTRITKITTVIDDGFVAQDRKFRSIIETKTSVKERVTLKGLIFAAAAWLAFWGFVYGLGHPIAGTVHGLGSNSKKQTGTVVLDLPYGWIGFFLGMIAAAFVIGYTVKRYLKIGDSTSTETNTTSQTTATATTATATNGTNAAPVPVRTAVPASTTTQAQPTTTGAPRHAHS